MKVFFWLARPRMLAARFRYWLWEKRNSDKPWLTPGAVAFLDARLTPDMVGIEFGSGRSTAWFARKVARLTSIEHHQGWHQQVQEQLAESLNVFIRLMAICY